MLRACAGDGRSTHMLGDKEGLCERRVFADVSAAAGDQNVHHTTERRCEALGCTRLYSAVLCTQRQYEWCSRRYAVFDATHASAAVCHVVRSMP